MNALLTLPTTSFEVARTETAITNKYGEIKVDDDIYHVPAAHPHQKLFLKVYWDLIEVYDEYGEKKITQCPRKYVQNTDKIDWIGELKIFLNKPRAIELATYLQALPNIIKQYLLPPDLSERRKRIKILISLLGDYKMTEIAKAVETGFERDKIGSADLRVLLEYQTSQSQQIPPLDESWTPESVSGWQPGLSEYDELCQEVSF